MPAREGRERGGSSHLIIPNLNHRWEPHDVPSAELIGGHQLRTLYLHQHGLGWVYHHICTTVCTPHSHKTHTALTQHTRHSHTTHTKHTKIRPLHTTHRKMWHSHTTHTKIRPSDTHKNVALAHDTHENVALTLENMPLAHKHTWKTRNSHSEEVRK